MGGARVTEPRSTVGVKDGTFELYEGAMADGWYDVGHGGCIPPGSATGVFPEPGLIARNATISTADLFSGKAEFFMVVA